MSSKDWREKNKGRVKEHNAKWYKRHREEHTLRSRNKTREVIRWLEVYKNSLVCSKCGFIFETRPECCDFHHIDSHNKSENITRLTSYGKKKVLAELGKCIPVCANCHRTIHLGKDNKAGKPAN